jgi:hypothetical protein
MQLNWRRLFLLISSLVLASAALAQQSQHSCRQDGPPSLKEIGPFVVKWGMILEEREKIMSQIRSFLWGHLENRTLGQVQVTFGNLEGDPTTHVLSIQGLKKGKAIVVDHVVTIEGALVLPGAKPKRKTSVDRFCAFERIDRHTHESIPDFETRAADSFDLHLKNCKKGPDLVL